MSDQATGLPDPMPVPLARGPVRGRLVPPGSKSLTQRWLMLAALAEGESVIDNALRSDDVEALAAGLVTLGAHVRWTSGDTIAVKGVGGRFTGGGTLDARDGGTPARFLMAAAAMGDRPSVIDGSTRLRERPMSDGAALLAAMGAPVRRLGATELPIEVHAGPAFRQGGSFGIDRPASSQFLSAIALVAPWLARGAQVQVHGGAPSGSYIELTVQCLRQLGVQASWDGEWLRVAHGPPVAFKVRVEPDASSAAYGFALAAMLPGSSVTVPGLRLDSAQPDLGVVHALRQMGAIVQDGPEGVQVAAGPGLHGGTFDASRWPDGSLALMAAAAKAEAPVELRGLDTLASKESDRIEAMRAWLMAAGVQVHRGPDWMRLQGPPNADGTVVVDTCRDHRIAMSAAVLGAVRGSVQVRDPACVRKSWPRFWSAWADLLGS